VEVVLDRVGRIYQWEWAVREVSARFKDAEIVCLLGANGSGKSTLLKLISGMIRPTSGVVQADQKQIRRGAIGLRRRMLLIQPDQPQLGINPLTHLGAAISLYQKDTVGIEDTAAKWIHEFGLAHNLSNDQVRLSRGQQMKLWLATLFTIRPDLWLLDEPHQCGLDAHGIEILESEMNAHRAAGGTIVFTSQWPPHARRLADRLLVLDEGKLAFEGDVGMLSQSVDSRDRSLAAIVRCLEQSETSGVIA
jgi:ABC-2 type transport system ATP-binding protein